MDGFWFFWFGAGALWGLLSYSGLLARSQRRYKVNAAANFRTDVACSLVIALLVLSFCPLVIVVYWATSGFDQGHQWWKGKR